MRYKEIKYNESIDISKEQWKRILQDNNITFDKNKKLLIRIYNKEDNMATAKELTIEEGKYGSSYNTMVVAWAKRIIKELRIEAPKNKEEIDKFSYWHVPFLGAREVITNNFLWIFREELLGAIEELFDENIWENNCGNNLISEQISEEYIVSEGIKKIIIVNSYERNKKAVRECIKYYKEKNGKVNCQICGFDFEKVYGVELKNKIHIHHKVPLSEIKKEYKLDSIRDLIPVCPNCHMVIHAKNPIYTIEEVKKMLNN
ncbi:MAG: HNH endonuclease [Sarcina sp.]